MKEGCREGRKRQWHLGIFGRDFELYRVDQLLPPAGVRRGSGRGRCQCVLHDDASLALGTFRFADCPRILAATSGQTMLRPREIDRNRVALGRRSSRRRNDFVPSADRWIYRRQVLRAGEMKKKRAVFLALAAVLVLLAIFYVWGPSSVPAGQEPLLKLSTANLSDFQKAFDAEADGPRIILLLSPT